MDRRGYGAECMREGSSLDWDAVREIRDTLCASREELRGHVTALAERFGVREHSIMDVFRNTAWRDPAYDPGFEVRCAGPRCGMVFRTTSTVLRYHSKECRAAAIAARAACTQATFGTPSPERREREEAALRVEAAGAEAGWPDALADSPRASVWTVASIDQPIGGRGAVLHDVLSAPSTHDDPAEELEHKVVQELLGGSGRDDGRGRTGPDPGQAGR